MFNFIKKKKIADAVKAACVECITVFKESVDDVLYEIREHDGMTDSEIFEKLDQCVKSYNNATSDRIFSGLIEMPSLRIQFLRVSHLPSVAGLPDTYTMGSLAEKGFDAAAIFATCYYMMTGEPVKEKDYRLMAELNKYQLGLMDIIMATVASIE